MQLILKYENMHLNCYIKHLKVEKLRKGPEGAYNHEHSAHPRGRMKSTPARAAPVTVAKPAIRPPCGSHPQTCTAGNGQAAAAHTSHLIDMYTQNPNKHRGETSSRS